MKLSVSLPDDDVALLDSYARAAGLGSRSAALQRAVQLLRHLDLEQQYEDAWREWDEGEDGGAWEATISDGLYDAAR